MAYLDEALKYAQSIDYATILGFCYLTKAQISLAYKDYRTALEHFNLAETQYTLSNDKKGLADLAYGKGLAYLMLDELDSAERFINESLRYYTSFKLKTGLEKGYRALYQIGKNKDRSDDALGYLELAEQYADSVSKQQNMANILMLKTRLEFNRLQEMEEQKAMATIDKQKKYIRLTTAGLVVAIVLVILIYNSSKRRRQLNDILKEKAKVLSEKERILNEMNRTKDRFFSIVGHDLRGPIVSLKQLVTLSLENTAEGPSYYWKFAPNLNRKLDHLQFTLDNLLHWGQTQMKGATTKPKSIHVQKALNDIITLFKFNLSEKKINLENLCELHIQAWADLDHFNIIFRNLISNAIKFTDIGGTITINCTVDVPSKIITITVTDDGIGMDATSLKKIWGDNEHHSTYGTQMEKGTGLGLVLCREMVSKNQGP